MALLDSGRRVTYLPGGGTLIEDQKFTTGIAISGDYITVQNCSIVCGDGIGLSMAPPSEGYDESSSEDEGDDDDDEIPDDDDNVPGVKSA